MKNDRDEGFWSGYAGMFSIIRDYYRAYGGLTSFVRSPYLHISIVLTLLARNTWMKPGWWEQPISVLPNLLGFSLGGYAIWLALGDENFRSKLAGRTVKKTAGQWASEDKVSPYVGVSATFAHYVVVQVSCLIYAVIGLSLNFVAPDDSFVLKFLSRNDLAVAAIVGGAIGYWLFLYSLTVTLAAGFGLFRISSWYDRQHTERRLATARQNDAGPSSANDEKGGG